MPEKSDSRPPNKIDLMVDECVRRCVATNRPLIALTLVLEALALDTILTDSEFAEVKRRTISGIADAFDADDPPGTLSPR